MKDQIPELPENKQIELSKVVTHIKKAFKIDMIILFGSFARGNWVADTYVDDYVKYEYQSDFDILVIVDDKYKEKIIDISHKIEAAINKDHSIKTPVSLLVEAISFINEQIEFGRYFYVDILKEGVILHDSEKFKLSTPKKLTKKEKRELSKTDLSIWMPKAMQAFDIYNFCLREHHTPEEYVVAEPGAKVPEAWYQYPGNSMYNWAAFLLHQAAESLLIAFSLVFTGYRPKTHNVERLLKEALKIRPELGEIFPRKTKEEKRIFNLLKRAYIDARYKKDYKVTKEELEYLEERIKRMKDMIEKLCEKEIEK